MSKNESGWARFCDWVNGEREEPESRLFSIGQAPQREWKREQGQPKKEEGQRLKGFLGWYPVVSVLIGLGIIGVLLATVLALPAFGMADNPTNNEVPAHYLEHTLEDTGATNAVAGMILNYRGFDTFGESCVLFLAVSCVFVLLLRDENNSRFEDGQSVVQKRLSGWKRDIILKEVARLLMPFILLFGLYIMFNGHLSPGGGFSGGAVLGGGLILYSSAFGTKAVRRFFNGHVYHAVKITGLCLYAVLFGYYIFMGANGLADHIPLGTPGKLLSAGILLPINVAVGLEVACTMYGFYAMFHRGEL